ncbi:MAG: AAA family ATPase [Solirubrobacterales bacterium]|nr:AAA family ATPase [Solirubrobacterales bacterium]
MTDTKPISKLPNKPSQLKVSPAAVSAVAANHTSMYVDNLFTATAAEEGLHCLRSASWVTKATNHWQLDAELLASLKWSFQPQEILYRVLDGLAQVVGDSETVRARIAAPSPASAKEIEKWLKGRMPEHIPDKEFKGEVDAKVVWCGREGGVANFSRPVPASRFEDLELNYSASTRNAIARLVEFKPPPAGGRLILFHGEPGTGKSHAITSLAAEWREWADLMIVTDVERLMNDPEYLLSMVRPDDRRGKKVIQDGRYNLLVLEDAGEFLAPQAKAETGQALSRLLNITDGILGEAGRSLMLITTNEHVSSLHPAVAREGRCMAEIEFVPLNRTEIEAWCEDRNIETPDGNSLTLAELYAATRDKPIRVERQSSIGFAA